MAVVFFLSGPGSSVGIATGYGLEGPGIESPLLPGKRRGKVACVAELEWKYSVRLLSEATYNK
jgi:hypothetical protein